MTEELQHSSDKLKNLASVVGVTVTLQRHAPDELLYRPALLAETVTQSRIQK